MEVTFLNILTFNFTKYCSDDTRQNVRRGFLRSDHPGILCSSSSIRASSLNYDDIAIGNTELPVPFNVSVTGLGTETIEDAAEQARVTGHLCNINSLKH